MERSILITGIPRSGTTWVGRMVALSPEVNYIHEPYNFLYHNILPGDSSPYQFQLGGDGALTGYYSSLLNYSLSWRDVMGERKDLSNVLNVISFLLKQRGYRKNGGRPLIKDQFSLFALDWYHEQFDVQPLIIIRHPAAVLASFKFLNWKVDFSNLVQYSENEEMSMHYGTDDISSADRIVQTAYLWNTSGQFIRELEGRHPDWMILRYEDIFRNLEDSFSSIFNYLGLELEDHLLSEIYYYTSNGYFSSRRSRKKTKIKRSDLYDGWKKKLDREDLVRLGELLDSDLLEHFSFSFDDVL